MRRIARDDLKRSIAIALRLVPNRVRRQYASKLALDRDAGADALAEVACQQIDDGKIRAFTPDLVPNGDWGKRVGEWEWED